MNPDPQPAATEPIDAAASQWLARRDRALSPVEQDEYLQWLRQDPTHGQAIARLEKAWTSLDSLAQWRPAHSPEPNPDLLATGRRPRFRLYGALAVLAAAAAAALLLFRPSAPTVEAPIVAHAYERRALSDGSVVQLNRGAEIQVRFTAVERRVELVRGEAHFTVAKDPARPFVVGAGKVAVHALGTVFNVALKADAVEVIVTEGKVRVEEPVVPAREVSNAPVLVAGQRALISTLDAEPQAVVATITPQEVSRALAWQPAQLEFTDTALAEIVAEFNRHGARPIVIGDPELASLRIGGSFRADNSAGFVRLLEASFGVRAEDDGREVVLRKRR